MPRKESTTNGHNRLEEAMTLLMQNQASLLARVAETDRQLTESEHRHLENQRHQVEFQRQQVEFQRQHADFERQHAEFVLQNRENERAAVARFAKIEADMAMILRVLAEHGRMLERLPDAVRDKIGFKSGQ